MQIFVFGFLIKFRKFHKEYSENLQSNVWSVQLFLPYFLYITYNFDLSIPMVNPYGKPSVKKGTLLVFIIFPSCWSELYSKRLPKLTSLFIRLYGNDLSFQPFFAWPEISFENVIMLLYPFNNIAWFQFTTTVLQHHRRRQSSLMLSFVKTQLLCIVDKRNRLVPKGDWSWKSCIELLGTWHARNVSSSHICLEVYVNMLPSILISLIFLYLCTFIIIMLWAGPTL